TNWRKKYIAYKKLKRLLKHIAALQGEALATTSETFEQGKTSDYEGQPSEHKPFLVAHEGRKESFEEAEFAFFQLLRHEQDKIEDFYLEQLKTLQAQFAGLREQVEQLGHAKVRYPWVTHGTHHAERLLNADVGGGDGVDSLMANLHQL